MEAQKAYIVTKNPIDLIKGRLEDLKRPDMSMEEKKVAFNHILVLLDGTDFIPVIMTAKGLKMDKSDSQELDEAVERVKNIEGEILK